MKNRDGEVVDFIKSYDNNCSIFYLGVHNKKLNKKMGVRYFRNNLLQYNRYSLFIRLKCQNQPVQVLSERPI